MEGPPAGILSTGCCDFDEQEHWLGAGSFVLSLNPGFAVWVYFNVESHRVAADRAVLDIVLVSAPGDVHRDHNLFAAGVADIGSLQLCCGLSAAA
jgi:hypothetical protein